MLYSLVFHTLLLSNIIQPFMTSFSKTLPPYISMAFESCPPFTASHRRQALNHTPLPSNLHLPDGRLVDQHQKGRRFQYRNSNPASTNINTFNIMATANPDEMEEFQRLSDRYQPDLQVSTANVCLSITDSVQGTPGEPETADRRGRGRVRSSRPSLRYQD